MSYIKDYLPHDKYCVINQDDSVLKSVVLKLPDPPDLKLIEGYGLYKFDQKFKRREVPLKLTLIEKRARKKAEEYNDQNKNNRANGYLVQKFFWQIIDDEKDSLEDELLWIKHTFWHLKHGYWFYNCGKPTYISPWYFFFLNFYYIDEAGKFPEYRDRDRRGELYEWYIYTCTETFKNRDQDTGRALDNEMVDVGRRVFYGTIEPKRRRGGRTAVALAHGLWVLMNERAAYCEIVADIGKHAKKIFDEKLSPAWYHMPLVIKPVWDGDERPTKSISLIHPKTVLKEQCLGSEFGYTESSSERANDSRRLCYLLSDEEGKSAVRADVNRRWGINMLTMSQMNKIHGYSNHPSTVEEMMDGGAEYKSMFSMSDFYVRNESGRTLSGLASIFFKAEDGADGYIDPWGYSVIDDPLPYQLEYSNKDDDFALDKRGAKRYLDEDLSILLKDGSHEKLKEYREKLRRNPRDSTDCWKGAAGDIGFNIIIIDKAIVDAKYKSVIQGNFRWAGGIRDSKVVFQEDKKGRWFVSDLLLGRENLKKRARGNYQNPKTGQYEVSWTPFNPLVTTIGIDSFRFRAASQVKSAQYGENTNLSDGGIAVYLNYDSSIDAEKPEHEWDTPRFICTYRARPGLDEYCEDVILTAHYFGGMVNGERNAEYIIQYMIERGYGGYLLYLMDSKGVVAPQPFTYSGGVNSTPKNDMLSLTKQHIDIHGHKESHIDLLNEWKNLSSPEDLHTKDLAAAAGWAIYGASKGYQKKYERITNGSMINLGGLLMPHRI